jgi:erythromycin esterase-like protein
MADPSISEKSLDQWIAQEAISFEFDSPDSLHSSADRLISAALAASSGSLELLGLGEPLHGENDFLVLRNRLFRHLAAKHGFSAIAIESSFPRASLVNDFVLGVSGASVESVLESGISHNMGALSANRELVEWMRTYNADPNCRAKLHFYGCDSPTEMTFADSPRKLLEFVLDYLQPIEPDKTKQLRRRIAALLGNDADWENAGAPFDPSKSIGLTPAAIELQAVANDLLDDITARRAELVAASDEAPHAQAIQYGLLATQMLQYHAAMASTSERRIDELLDRRDEMIAGNLAYISAAEKVRDPAGGRVLVFAHNYHLKYGPAQWQLGPMLWRWQPAGVHVRKNFGARYVVIGSGIAASAAHSIGPAEAGTLEARLSVTAGRGSFIPTHLGAGLNPAEIAALPTRSANPAYFPFTAQSLTDFDWLVVL